MTNGITIEVESKSGKLTTYYVKRGGTVIGILEKWRDTRTCKHPWKAYGGAFPPFQFLGAFYAERGGRDAAISMILDNA